MVYRSFEKDRGRSGSDKEKSIKELANATLMKLKEDSLYLKEYIQFVDTVSYAIDDEKITFDIALNSFEVIVGLF